jgi:hypothetical protein
LCAKSSTRAIPSPKSSRCSRSTSGRVLGTILNEIVEDSDGDLALKFTFRLSVEGIEPGSTAERDFAGQMEEGYLMAVAATLKAMRKLASENALPAM